MRAITTERFMAMQTIISTINTPKAIIRSIGHPAIMSYIILIIIIATTANIIGLMIFAPFFNAILLPIQLPHKAAIAHGTAIEKIISPFKIKVARAAALLATFIT